MKKLCFILSLCFISIFLQACTLIGTRLQYDDSCESFLVETISSNSDVQRLTSYYEQILKNTEDKDEDSLLGYYFSFHDEDSDFFDLALVENYFNRVVSLEHYLVDKLNGNICIQDIVFGECSDEYLNLDSKYYSNFEKICKTNNSINDQKFKIDKNQLQTPEQVIQQIAKLVGVAEEKIYTDSFYRYLRDKEQFIDLIGPYISFSSLDLGETPSGIINDVIFSSEFGWKFSEENSYADPSEGTIGYIKDDIICLVYQHIDEDQFTSEELEIYYDGGWVDYPNAEFITEVTCSQKVKYDLSELQKGDIIAGMELVENNISPTEINFKFEFSKQEKKSEQKIKGSLAYHGDVMGIVFEPKENNKLMIYYSANDDNHVSSINLFAGKLANEEVLSDSVKNRLFAGETIEINAKISLYQYAGVLYSEYFTTVVLEDIRFLN